jgi:5-methylcytosine-specific restriction endonuclease McrA
MTPAEQVWEQVTRLRDSAPPRPLSLPSPAPKRDVGNSRRRRHRSWLRKRIQLQGGQCNLCNRRMVPLGDLAAGNPARPTLDHVIPLSKGGADCWLNTQAACWACNQAKGDSMPEMGL